MKYMHTRLNINGRSECNRCQNLWLWRHTPIHDERSKPAIAMTFKTWVTREHALSVTDQAHETSKQTLAQLTKLHAALSMPERMAQRKIAFYTTTHAMRKGVDTDKHVVSLNVNL